MASTSQVHKSGGAGPISAHPAFPLVVALWFAALLGLGSLVLPIALLERLVTATGLADLVPAAAPPLGFTARLAIALAGTALGAMLGLFAARKIARRAPDHPRRRSSKAEENPRRQPLSAREELGSDSFDSVAGFATARRRALAGVEEVGKSDLFQAAPLPGQGHGHGFAYAEKTPDPLDLAECAEFTEVQDLAGQDAPEEEIAMSQWQVLSPNPGESAGAEPLPFSPPSMARREPQAAAEAEAIEFAAFEDEPAPVEPEPRQEFIMPQAMPEETPEIAEATATAAPQEGEPDLVQLVQKLGATLEKHREWTAQRTSQLPEAPRFPRAVAAPALADGDFDMAAPAEAAQAMAAFFAPEPEDEPALEAEAEFETGAPDFSAPPPVAVRPDAAGQLRPFAGLAQVDDAEDDEDLDHIAASFSLPLGRAPVAAQGPAPAIPETDDDSASEAEAYSSLLVMKNPFRDHRPEFVRVEEPEPEPDAAQPAVVFPHEAAAAGFRPFDRPAAASAAVAEARAPAPMRPATSGDDNDRVLREALMNLQRIGKN